MAWSVGAALVLVAALAGYLLWSGLSARSDLKRAESDARALQAALLDGDRSAADAALKRFATHTDSARGRTDGPLWAAAAHLPWVGDNFEAVRLIAWSASEVGRQAHVALFGDADRDLFTDLAPRNGRIDLDVVREVGPLMARLDRSLSTSTSKLRRIDSAGLNGLIRPSFDRFRDKLVDAQRAMSGADTAVRILPEMLGAEQPKTYLLRFGNNAEIRSTGGLPGAWALLRAERGKLSIVRQGSAASDFPEFPAPVLPLTPAEREIWGVQPAVYFHDTNFIPDFPRSAELTHAMWAKRFPQDRLDGIAELDAVTLSYVLRATGPVPVPGTGVTLTADNAVEELLSKVYQRLPGNAEQDEFFAAAAKAVFDKVSSGVASPATLLRALSSGVNEGRVRINAVEPGVQRELSGSAIAGELPVEDNAASDLGVYLNDATGAKMSYYLRTSLKSKAAGCDGGQQRFTSTATFSQEDVDVSTLPDYVTGGGVYGTEPGQQLVTVTVYGPTGGSLTDLAFDGKQTDAVLAEDRGRPVMLTAVQLVPGQRVEVTWTTTAKRGSALRQQLTPGLEARDGITHVEGRCA